MHLSLPIVAVALFGTNAYAILIRGIDGKREQNLKPRWGYLRDHTHYHTKASLWPAEFDPADWAAFALTGIASTTGTGPYSSGTAGPSGSGYASPSTGPATSSSTPPPVPSTPSCLPIPPYTVTVTLIESTTILTPAPLPPSSTNSPSSPPYSSGLGTASSAFPTYSGSPYNNSSSALPIATGPSSNFPSTPGTGGPSAAPSGPTENSTPSTPAPYSSAAPSGGVSGSAPTSSVAPSTTAAGASSPIPSSSSPSTRSWTHGVHWNTTTTTPTPATAMPSGSASGSAGSQPALTQPSALPSQQPLSGSQQGMTQPSINSAPTISTPPTTTISGGLPTGTGNSTPNAAVVYCGVHGYPSGDWYLGTYDMVNTRDAVTIEGCYELCKADDVPDSVETSCLSYEFWHEGSTGAPRCNLYSGSVGMSIRRVEGGAEGVWWDLGCGVPVV